MPVASTLSPAQSSMRQAQENVHRQAELNRRAKELKLKDKMREELDLEREEYRARQEIELNQRQRWQQDEDIKWRTALGTKQFEDVTGQMKGVLGRIQMATEIPDMKRTTRHVLWENVFSTKKITKPKPVDQERLPVNTYWVTFSISRTIR